MRRNMAFFPRAISWTSSATSWRQLCWKTRFRRLKCYMLRIVT